MATADATVGIPAVPCQVYIDHAEICDAPRPALPAGKPDVSGISDEGWFALAIAIHSHLLPQLDAIPGALEAGGHTCQLLGLGFLGLPGYTWWLRRQRGGEKMIAAARSQAPCLVEDSAMAWRDGSDGLMMVDVCKCQS